jgi:hypothetical protein
MVRGVVNRSPSLETMAFQGCSRLGDTRIDCRLTARGRSASVKTGCHFTVAVGARNRHPVAHFSRHSCRSVAI